MLLSCFSDHAYSFDVSNSIQKQGYQEPFGEVFDVVILVNLVKIAKLKLANIDYSMCTYGAKNSDHQIKQSPFTKFNACQNFPIRPSGGLSDNSHYLQVLCTPLLPTCASMIINTTLTHRP